MKTRYDELLESANKCHADHPELWDWFCKFTFDRIDKGYKHYSTNTIFQRCRWETAIGDDGKEAFKLNNNHAPFYARGFMLKYPEHEGFFRLREMTSHDKPALGKELKPKDYEYIN